MTKVEIKTNKYTKTEKAILRKVEWDIEDDFYYSLNEISDRSNLELKEAEKAIEKLIKKGIARKESKGYIFDYLLFSFEAEELASVNQLRMGAIRDRVCP